MGRVDDVSGRPRSDDGSDGRRVYRTDRATSESGRSLGGVDGERFREVLLRHPGACKAFKMISGTGYRDPAEAVGTYSAAEHAGRVEADVESVAGDIYGGHVCEVMLGTADPQLATIRNGVERAQVEFDSARVRWVAPDPTEEPDA